MTSDALQPGWRPSGYRLAVCLYLAVAVTSGFGLLGKAQLVRRIVPLPATVLFPTIFICLLLPLFWQLVLKARRQVAVIVCLGIVVASTLVYPRMQDLQKSGRGTDQPDCVIVAAQGIASGTWPYNREKLWTHNPMSCGPGWVLLQTPVIVSVGYRWNLVLLWLLALLLIRTALPIDTVAGLLTLIGLSAVTWVTASDGTDFLPFGILLATLFVLVQSPGRLYPWALGLAALVVQFRFPMLVLPILFIPYKRIYQGLAVSLAAFGCQLFFLLWRPEAYIADGPLHLFFKLTHTHLLAVSRTSSALEVSAVFALMAGACLLVRRYIRSPWIALAYLFLLTALPAALDLVHKEREFGSLLAGLSLWEGANWMSGCLPLAALLLVVTRPVVAAAKVPLLAPEPAVHVPA